MGIFVKIGMPILWSILIVAFSIIEGFTLGLTSIWFALGAIFALIFSLFKVSIFIQIVIFIISSIVMLIYTKPIAQKKLKVGSTKTNVEELIGKTAIVVKKIGEYESGQVKVKGQIWTAVSENNKEIEVNNEVVIVLVEGVKLIVKLI